MKKVLKNISRVLFSLLLVVSIFGVVNVLAAEVIFKITDISVKEKSDAVTVNDVSLSGETINNDVVFTYLNDYITYDITIKNVVVPDVVDIIVEESFSICVYSNDFILDNHIDYRSCYNIESIKLPESLKIIKKLAFYEAKNMTSMTIPKSVNRIEEEIFYYLSNLANVTLENTEGWKVGNIDLEPTDLENSATVATYLKSNYKNAIWTRSE